MTAVFAIQTALVGFVFTVAESSVEAVFATWWSWVPLFIALLLTAASIYFSIRSYWGQTYEFIGSPKDISAFYVNKISWAEFAKQQNSGDEDEHMNEIYDDFVDRFTRSIETTVSANNQKSGFRHRSIGFLIGAVVAIGICYMLYSSRLI